MPGPAGLLLRPIAAEASVRGGCTGLGRTPTVRRLLSRAPDRAARRGGSRRVLAKKKEQPLEGRPDPRDVVRLSRGQKALTRGTGNRDVAHRLNAEEAKQFEVAQKRRFVVLKGDGHRRERRGSPLANTWRQWADAFEWACVQVRQGSGGASKDVVVVDLSPLRTVDDAEHRAIAGEAAAAHGCPMVREDPPAGVLRPEAEQQLEAQDLPDEGAMARLAGDIEAAGAAVVDAKAEHRAEAEAAGSSVNQHPAVKAAVLQLKRLRARMVEMEEAVAEHQGRVGALLEMAAQETEFVGAIWELRPVELHFEAPDRATARALATQLAADLCPDRPQIKT